MKMTATLVKLGTFVVVMVFFTAAVIVVFAQMRFGEERIYRAEFRDASGLKDSEFVRIAGVEVGNIRSTTVSGDATALIEFSVRGNVAVNESTRLAVRYENLVGEHYLELIDTPGPSAPQPPDTTIPIDRTAPALDLDALINGFRPLFKALEPEQVNRLSRSLVSVLQGEGGTVSSLLLEASELTSTLADRDELIGSVIDNLNRVLTTVDQRTTQFDEGVVHLQELISGLAAQSDPIGDALVHVNNASRSVASLLLDNRPVVQRDVHELGRVLDAVNSDKDYVDWVLGSLPEAYQRLSRLGLYGDFFTFYLCDVTLKVNGPDGNPVYVPIIGQRAGRCTP